MVCSGCGLNTVPSLKVLRSGQETRRCCGAGTAAGGRAGVLGTGRAPGHGLWEKSRPPGRQQVCARGWCPGPVLGRQHGASEKERSGKLACYKSSSLGFPS